MSQAKVDRYKEEKKNRAQLIKKAKREWMAMKAGLSLVAIVLVAWVGVAVYQGVHTPEAGAVTEKPTYEVNTTAIDSFLSDLDAEVE